MAVQLLVSGDRQARQDQRGRAVTVLELQNDAEATIRSGAQINQETDQTNGDQKVVVEAISHNQTINLGGNIALPSIGTKPKGKYLLLPDLNKPGGGSVAEKGKGAVGATVLVFDFRNTTIAKIESGVDLLDSLKVTAESNVINGVLSGSGGKAGKVAFNGVVVINLLTNTTIAQIADGATIDVGSGLVYDPNDPDTDPSTNGAVVVDASDVAYIASLAGGVAMSNQIGIGASVIVNVINRDTEAVIGHLVDDDAAGVRGSFTADGDVRVNAKNDGFIISLAVAGSKTSSSPSPNSGGGKSNPGTGGTQGSTGTSQSNADLTNWQSKWASVLKEGVEKNKLSGNIAGSASGSAGQTGQAKSGIAISGSVAVDVVLDDARAYVLGTGALKVTGGTLYLNAKNSTSIGSLAGAVAIATSSDGGSTKAVAVRLWRERALWHHQRFPGGPDEPGSGRPGHQRVPERLERDPGGGLFLRQRQQCQGVRRLRGRQHHHLHCRGGVPGHRQRHDRPHHTRGYRRLAPDRHCRRRQLRQQGRLWHRHRLLLHAEQRHRLDIQRHRFDVHRGSQRPGHGRCPDYLGDRLARDR